MRRVVQAAQALPWLALACVMAAAPAAAYEGSLHQELTFIAAKHFNNCAGHAALPRLTPLQVRYIAKANVRQTEANIFRRMTRWNYYDREEQRPRSMLWFIQTRMHQHFNRLVAELDAAEALADRYSGLGRIVNYVQDMTSPAHVVPVFTARWWRWDISDRFDRYPVDADAVSAAVGDDCTDLEANAGDWDALLSATAERTLSAVREQIPGLPVSWQVFWRIGDPGGFGGYGGAGNNFGRPAEFDCGGRSRAERCVLLERDPLYEAFAADRHLDAVRATITAMWMLQHGLPELSSMGRAE
ncbi:MAG: hypothetical protein OXM56_14125 [Gammaproteobacteria bacterium]|nr:hypothetical protein [Gammaproteobacteria bacterium]